MSGPKTVVITGASRGLGLASAGHLYRLGWRVVEAMRVRMPVDEVSVGDYVLAGGEAAALVMIEAVARLLPGVLGNASSAGDDSFGGHGDPAGATGAEDVGAKDETVLHRDLYVPIDAHVVAHFGARLM